ncbi:UNVERIFIED_CONTAM: hypothetical protein MT386_01780 [Aeromonas salmonicida]
MAVLHRMGAAQPLPLDQLQAKVTVALHGLLPGSDALPIQPAVVQSGLKQGIATDQGIGGTVGPLAGQHVAAIYDGEGRDKLPSLLVGKGVSLGQHAILQPLRILVAQTVVALLLGLRALRCQGCDEGVVVTLVGQWRPGAEDEGAIP